MLLKVQRQHQIQDMEERSPICVGEWHPELYEKEIKLLMKRGL